MSARWLAARTAPMPRVLWIELTSRCPFDCVFCTRASLRGAGVHLEFALYERIIGELDRPAIIRLNYAGESGHYPQLAQAVALAAATGATVELVSALASLKPERLKAALEAGLSRLTVSLHTLDAARFDAIYRFSSLESMHARFAQVLDWRARSPRPFVLDLAFVAMRRNLDELPALAAFAARHAIPVLSVHPLIGRDPLPLGRADEHDARGQLGADFRAELGAALAAARAAAPQVDIQLSSHELQAPALLSAQAQAWPWPLPEGAAIAGCDQDPFESVHILADGRVVACEVTERVALGDLREQSLRAIWQGERYRDFRAAHVRGSAPACRECVYKRACRPAPAQARVDAGAPAQQWLRGWHADEGSGLRWGAADAAIGLRGSGERRLRLRGVFAPATSDARFEVHVDGELLHAQPARGGLEGEFALARPAAADCLVELRCPQAMSPQALGAGGDVRELGFGLIEAQLL